MTTRIQREREKSGRGRRSAALIGYVVQSGRLAIFAAERFPLGKAKNKKKKRKHKLPTHVLCAAANQLSTDYGI